MDVEEYVVEVLVYVKATDKDDAERTVEKRLAGLRRSAAIWGAQITDVRGENDAFPEGTDD